jgi:rhodanese-related sulfurtransferase
VTYAKEGFTNLKVLGGGVEGWKNAGYPLAA